VTKLPRFHALPAGRTILRGIQRDIRSVSVRPAGDFSGGRSSAFHGVGDAVVPTEIRGDRSARENPRG